MIKKGDKVRIIVGIAAGKVGTVKDVNDDIVTVAVGERTYILATHEVEHKDLLDTIVGE